MKVMNNIKMEAMTIKNKLFYLFFLILFLININKSHAYFFYKEIIVNDLNDVEETIEIGNKIIKAANNYKKNNSPRF